ncbi:hypothetical protein KPL78_07155 [Roseomonas sp. HJA6]|uniref:Uncharacterized protein n=1 Tax=Roseomonas alba TaxID=2846776 RepID=A0ABS7A5Q7_9PROT|nr:hypothetical protein [Neoroseomonas alba]MBW6397615.1 hypothetical protein [Neoroseomonas alba]
MSAPVSPLAILARDMEDRIGDALDGLATLETIIRSDDWPALTKNEPMERLRSALEWTVGRLKADLSAALSTTMEARS